jgi:hypothetical protein
MSLALELPMIFEIKRRPTPPASPLSPFDRCRGRNIQIFLGAGEFKGAEASLSYSATAETISGR